MPLLSPGWGRKDQEWGAGRWEHPREHQNLRVAQVETPGQRGGSECRVQTWMIRRVGQPPWRRRRRRRGQPQAGELSVFPCPARLPQQCHLLKAAGEGTARTMDKKPEGGVLGYYFLQIMVQAWGLGTISDE